ncbi:MAG: ABC transporter [Microbacterium sp.]
MSDPNYGEPVQEITPEDAASVDDAVASAHEGLADAEAASRDVVAEATDAVAADQIGAAAGVPDAATQVVDSADATATQVVDSGSDLTLPYETYATPDVAPAATAVAAAPVVPVVAPTPQPIFVQAPEAPRPRGNRAAAGLIGLLAAISFGILYLAAALGFEALAGNITDANAVPTLTAALASWWFWVPVVTFFLGFWLLGAIINRGRWGHWVVFGLLVGFIAYGGHLLGQLFQAPFWTLTASQGAQLVEDELLAPLGIVAFILGRELTIWFGAWVAARGKRVTDLNIAAQREYERTLEAGPRIHQI